MLFLSLGFLKLWDITEAHVQLVSVLTCKKRSNILHTTPVTIHNIWRISNIILSFKGASYMHTINERHQTNERHNFDGWCVLSVIMYVITGWTWLSWPSRNSGGNWYWTSWTKGKCSYGLTSEYFLVLRDVLSAFLWVSLVKFSYYINLQGDMGFQGRPGPPGPPGVGEPGSPVS